MRSIHSVNNQLLVGNSRSLQTRAHYTEKEKLKLKIWRSPAKSISERKLQREANACDKLVTLFQISYLGNETSTLRNNEDRWCRTEKERTDSATTAYARQQSIEKPSITQNMSNLLPTNKYFMPSC